MTKGKDVAPRQFDAITRIAKDCSQRAQQGEFAVVYLIHAREQMEKRCIDQKHVLQVLEFGRVVEDGIRFNVKENDYSYLIRDQNVEGRDMAVSIAIKESEKDMIVIITAMLIDPNSGRY